MLIRQAESQTQGAPEKLICDLVPYAGKYTFDKSGVETTVKV